MNFVPTIDLVESSTSFLWPLDHSSLPRFGHTVKHRIDFGLCNVSCSLWRQTDDIQYLACVGDRSWSSRSLICGIMSL